MRTHLRGRIPDVASGGHLWTHDELRSALAAFAEDARFVVVVTDADGVLLWREGSAAVRRQADALGFAEGADWSEGSVGTNAIGTAGTGQSSPIGALRALGGVPDKSSFL